MSLAQSEGIFADFETAAGNFTVQLDYTNAPRAVAGFIGLATGESAWMDEEGAVWRTPFYDGSLFHRVLPGMVVQGGGKERREWVYTPRAGGPAYGSQMGASLGRLTLPEGPGEFEQDFGVFPLVLTNAAGVAITVTNDAGEVVEALQPMRTQQAAQMIVQSHCARGWLVQTNWLLKPVWVTNQTESAGVSEYEFPVRFSLPNPTNTSFVYDTNYVVIKWESTNVLWGVDGRRRTNFVNAGYYGLDECENGLKHVRGAISMANSGPNTDGSQFFITVSNAVPSFDGSYTVFGRVTAGMEVADAMAAVTVDVDHNERPWTNLPLTRVTIRRVGAAAEAFDIAAQGVPRIYGVPIAFQGAEEEGEMTVEVTLPLFSETALWGTDRLEGGWNRVEDWGYRADSTVAVRRVTGGAKGFFHAPCVEYPYAWASPSGIRGESFRFVYELGGNQTVEEVHFSEDWSQQGTFTRVMGTNVMRGELFSMSDEYIRLPYSARMYFLDNQFEHTYSLRFDPGCRTNRFSGTCKTHVGAYLFRVEGTVEWLTDEEATREVARGWNGVGKANPVWVPEVDLGALQGGGSIMRLP